MSSDLSGNTVSYNGGKFKLAGTYEYTDGSIIFKAKSNITNNFNSKHYGYLRWSTDGGTTWLPSATGVKSGATHISTDFSWAQRTVTGRSLKVAVRFGSSSWSTDTITIASTQAPSSISATKLNDSCIRVVVSGTSNINKPTSKITIERSTSLYSGWSSIAEITSGLSGTSYSISYDDESVESGQRYYYRANAYNASSGDSDYITSDAVYTSADSGDVSDVSTSQSGNTVTVSWTCSLSAIQSGSIASFEVQRSSGSTYTTIATVDAESGQSNYTYTDTVSSGASYSYRIVPSGSGGTSSGGATGGSDIETAPSAPSGITAYRNSKDYVIVTVTGSSDNADKVAIERNIDSEGWEPLTTLDYPTQTYTDETATASDSVQYRARYSNDVGYSGYVESNIVQVKSKPDAPNLKSPYNGTPIDMAQGTVRLVWEHRPTDGSAQEAATLQYAVNGGSWTSVSFTTETYYDLSVESFSANDVITWRVSTKGAYSEYSDYSSTYSLTLLTRPTLKFTSPDNADVIDALPVVMEWAYYDESGALKELTVDVVKDNETVKTFSVDVGSGASGTYTHSLAGFLFENNSVYGLKATALSSSGLTAEDNITITIQYEEVSIGGGLLPSIVSDSETGYCYVTCLRDVTDGVSPVEIAEAYLYRVHDNETVLISAVDEGVQILDKLAPINVDYEYKLLYMTTDGRVSIVSVTVYNQSEYWFCYFGNEIAKAIWSPSGEVKLSRPQRTEVRYSGRRFPVSYDQDALEETYSFSTTLTERSELNQFRKMMQKGGQGIWKSGDGDAYYANFEFGYSNDFAYPGSSAWSCTLDVTRIDGGE